MAAPMLALLLLLAMPLEGDVLQADAPSAAGDVPAERRSDSRDKIVVVFDAGSTSTKAYVCQLRSDANNPSGFDFVKVTKYGGGKALSSYRNSPERAGGALKILLKNVTDKFPEKIHGKIWAILAATAGLRLLDSAQQRRILVSVRKELEKKSEFRLPKYKAVSVITGNQEAKYLWAAVNFRMNNLSGNSVPVIEMGGASVQIAYKAKDGVAITQNFHSKSDIPLHVHSYLKLGTDQLALSHIGQPGKDGKYKSKCVKANLKATVKLDGGDKAIVGEFISNSDRSSFCSKEAARIVKEKNIHQESVLNNGKELKIYCFSSLYYQLKFLRGKFNADLSAGGCGSIQCKAVSANLSQLPTLAKRVCENPPNKSHHHYFYCLQLHAVHSLMKDHMGLAGRTKLVGISAGWANWGLGLALEFLNGGFDVKTEIENSAVESAPLCLLVCCAAFISCLFGY